MDKNLTTVTRNSSAGGVVVITPSRLPPVKKEFLWALLHGFCCFVAAALLMLANEIRRDNPIVVIELLHVLLALTIAWPIVRLRRNAARIATVGRVAVLGVIFAIGFLGVPIIAYIFTAIFGVSIRSGWSIPFFLGLLIGVDVICIIAWLLVRLTLPRFVVQNGTLCPDCGYCVIGVFGLRCPECGRSFTYDELETTEEEFVSHTMALRSGASGTR